MLRTLSITGPLAAVTVALGAALALPAAAETTIKVDVAGLDAPAAHARIVQAAKAACRVEMRDSTTFEQYYQWSGCLNDAVAGAESQLKGQQAALPVANKSAVAGR